jgi:putative ATPase
VDDGGMVPIANDLRPTELKDFVGQTHIIYDDSWLKNAIESDNIGSVVLFGPPGSGKTTLASIIAKKTKANFVHLNATGGSAKQLKEELEIAQQGHASGKKTIVFIDEIHRFNKSQQDVLLPFIERGVITLIGATTENPSFSVISPIISRSKVIQLERLDDDSLEKILDKAIKKFSLKLDKKAKKLLIESSNGDARILLNLFEDLLLAGGKDFNEQSIKKMNLVKTLKYDKSGEEHYNIISALHKSMRDSDPDGAVYYLMRMIDAGEDPLYIARRLVRFASEDIGLADPHALMVAVAAFDSCRFIGLPECDVSLAQAVIHLSCAPKSNACYKAVLSARSDIGKTGNLDVPKHLRNSVTKVMKQLGYGEGYKYAHDFEDAKVDQQHLPEKLKNRKYYIPTMNGLEMKISQKFKK